MATESHLTFDIDSRKLERKLAMQKHRKLDESVEIQPKSTRIVDQFFLLGKMPPMSKGAIPSMQVIMALPPIFPTDITLDQIFQYCFPTDQNRAHLSSNSKGIIQDEFVFSILHGDVPVYGICVHITPKSCLPPFYSAPDTKGTVFCMCFISHVPSFGAHASFLSYWSKLASGLENPRDFDNREDIVNFEGNLMPTLIADDCYGLIDGIRIPRQFANDIINYLSKPLNVQLVHLTNSLDATFAPPTSNSILLSTIEVLFSLFQTKDLVRLFSALLLDAQVVVYGSNLFEISSTVFALSSFLSPYNFSGNIIPILPHSAQNFMFFQNPTPFLIGTPTCQELTKIQFLDTAIFVNVDRKSISPTPEFPDYPDSADVIRGIESNKSSTRIPNPYGFPFEYRKSRGLKLKLSTKQISGIMKALHKPLFLLTEEQVNAYFVTDSTSPDFITIFNNDLFLASIPHHYIPFFKEFVESQTFNMYIDVCLTHHMKMLGKQRVEHLSAPRPLNRRLSVRTKKHIVPDFE